MSAPRGTQVRDMIVQRLGMAILEGRHQPGDTLPHELVASADHKVSRGAYREAIRVLETLGLIETRKKAGTRVCARSNWNLLHPEVLHWMIEMQPNADFLSALFEVRRVIEPAAAAMAAGRRTPAHVARLQAAIATMRDNPVDSPPYQAADRDFHQAILDATGNELLLRLGSIVLASLDYVATYKRKQHIPRDPAVEHLELLGAIITKNPAGARDAMERHNHLGHQDTLTGLRDMADWKTGVPSG